MIELKINMDMPVSCACCPFLRELRHNWCAPLIWDGMIEDDSRRPDWCPLIVEGTGNGFSGDVQGKRKAHS